MMALLMLSHQVRTVLVIGMLTTYMSSPPALHWQIMRPEHESSTQNRLA
jgi:hypothetical protein